MNHGNKKLNTKKIADFLFEVGYLNKITRSKLKKQKNSIAEHSFRVTIIGYILATLEKADIEKTLLMCLFHDIPETRTGDADLVNRCYLKINELKALKDTLKDLPIEKNINNIFKEYQKNKTKEIKIIHDADILEELLTEKQQYDDGLKEAKKWMNFSVKKLTTKHGKLIGNKILKQKSNDWWEGIIKQNYIKK